MNNVLNPFKFLDSYTKADKDIFFYLEAEMFTVNQPIIYVNLNLDYKYT